MPLRGRYTPFNLAAFNATLDHGLLLGLDDDDHSQYWLAGTARTGNFSTSGTLGAGAITGTSFTDGVMTISAGAISGLDTVSIDSGAGDYPLDIVGYNSSTFLQIRLGLVDTDDTAKAGGFVIRHYDNDEEDVVGLFAASTGSGNDFYWGGGLATGNAATSHQFCTAADDTTTTGSVRLLIASDGKVIVYNAFEVQGASIFKDKVSFTQTDNNEYIDSLNDGYMDYGATTGHRFNNDLTLPLDKWINFNAATERIGSDDANYLDLQAATGIRANADLDVTGQGTFSTGVIVGGDAKVFESGGYLFLSSDATTDSGRDISIPITGVLPNQSFYYGYGGSAHHKFGSTSQVEISDDGIITAVSLICPTIGVSGDTNLLGLAANALTVNGTIGATGVITGAGLTTAGDIGDGTNTLTVANAKTAYDHSQATHDYAYITGNDGATDVTAAELEELTDGSVTALHSHAAGGGSMTTVKEGGVQLGGADIVTLDFDGDDFNLTEDPDTEVNITINNAGIDHDATTNFEAGEHFAQADITTTGTVTTGTWSSNITMGANAFKPRYLNQAAQPSPAEGELMIWRDSDASPTPKVYLLFNDPTNGIIDALLS